MRTTAIALILMLLGSVSMSSADQYEITFTNMLWEPNYDLWETVFPTFPRPPEPAQPVILNGSLTWDSTQRLMTERNVTLSGHAGLAVGFTNYVTWESQFGGLQGPLRIELEGNPGIPGFPGIALLQFIDLEIPGTIPNPDVGPVPVNLNFLRITQAGGALWQGVAVSGSESVTLVAVPEPAVLRRLMPKKHLLGPQLATLVNPSLQRVTAWGAAAMLRAVQIPAVQHGVYVDLPSVSLEVQEWCSGLVSMKWLLLLAVFIALVGSGSVPWKIALVVIAPLIALEANMLRVASIGVGLELAGYDHRAMLKDWTGWAAIAFGVVQVVGLGRLMNRRPI